MCGKIKGHQIEKDNFSTGRLKEHQRTAVSIKLVSFRGYREGLLLLASKRPSSSWFSSRC